MSCTRVQKTIIIVNFSNCSNCRTRIFICGFLFNRNCRGKTFYQINIRFIHASKKLPCIRRKTFHIAALTFRKKRVKRKGTFSRTRKPGNHNKFVSRNIQINIFKIMLARTADYYFIVIKNTCHNRPIITLCKNLFYKQRTVIQCVKNSFYNSGINSGAVKDFQQNKKNDEQNCAVARIIKICVVVHKIIQNS